MLSQPKNRVQAIKSKFENLGSDPAPVKQTSQLYKLKNVRNKENAGSPYTKAISINIDSDTSGSDEESLPNHSYLHSDVKRSVSEPKPLSRQCSDPGKKLHRSHAFRCDRTQKITSPKRSGSCHSRPESLKMDRKLSKDRLKRLGDILDVQMKKENFTLNQVVGEIKEVSVNESLINSIPDKNVPPHILEQYAQVIKPKKDDTNEVMTDSGVSSETENLEEEKGRVKKITSQFEKDSNLDGMEVFAGSSETMKLERKNPHLVLTDTLKKALKQPLPPGPPPKKPPRTFVPTIPESEKKDTKRKLEKLEQMLLKRENNTKRDGNIYDIAEENLSLKKPKEVHYLCTEILDITQRTLLPNQNESAFKNCFDKLNCVTSYNSMSSLPYTRLSADFDANQNNRCSCSNNSLSDKQSLIGKCTKCKMNEKHDHFKCHLDCKCRSSEFYVDEHIYDEPCVSDVVKNHYGTINNVKCSKSMEDLRGNQKEDIYEIPCDRPSTPDPGSPKISRADFQKLVQNFEKNTESPKNKDESKIDGRDTSLDVRRSLENDVKRILENELKCMDPVMIKEAQFSKKERKYPTEVRRHKAERVGYSLKRNPQIDVDRENLNALMNEIYETVTAACNMEENKPGSFPTDQGDSGSSEESVKLTRSLTEKRKNYVRRVSSRLAYLDPNSIKTPRFRHQTSICSYKSDVREYNQYNTFRSWKSFRASQNNLTSKMESDSKFNLTDSTGNILSIKNDFDISDGSIDALSIDEKAGCVEIELPFEPREQGLFNVCLLVGLNYMTGQAYVKSVFPSQVQVPQHIENLIFPETLSQDKGEWSADATHTQCYSFVLTDERGERSYGYCRRVLPEGATACLPLCYCLIGKYRAPGFYYKVLQELESHHGVSEHQINNVLQQLFESDFPNPGEEITLTIENDSDVDSCQICDKCKEQNCDCDKAKRKSSLTDKCVNDKCVTDKCKTMPEMKSEKLYDLENNNSFRELMISLDGVRIKTISRPLEARAEESSSCCLLDSLGAGLLVKVFGSLLLERKLIVRADELTTLSSCLEGLQSALYPFVWQQPLISCVPAELTRAVIDAPLPVLAGLTDRQTDVSVDEGMFVDLSHPSKVLCYQGDESTILPTNSYKALKTALQMESIKNKDRDDTRTRNVMISEAFLRFFVDILGDFWRHFSRGVQDDMAKGGVVFDKDSFIKNATSKQNQYFLEWFTETAMFNHFIQNMTVRYKQTEPDSYKNDPQIDNLIDTPTPNFYDLFEERIHSRRIRTNVDRSGYKSALNKRVKLLKARLKDLVG